VGVPVSTDCTKCSHYARGGPKCLCSPGYVEVTTGSLACHAPKPTACQKWLRMESAGVNANQVDSNYLRVYINDVKLGADPGYGINFYELDANFAVTYQ